MAESDVALPGLFIIAVVPLTLAQSSGADLKPTFISPTPGFYVQEASIIKANGQWKWLGNQK